MSTATDLRLTPLQIATYHTQGFLALPPLTNAGELVWLREAYDRMFVERRGRAVGDQFDLFGDDADAERANVPQILHPDRHLPGLRESGLWRAAVGVFAQLFAGEPDYVATHAICKPPRSPLATPWHQDEAYWGAGSDFCAGSLWVPLQDVDERTGCMHFLPRSHLGDILPHRPAGNDPRVHGLELDCPLPDPERIAAVPLAGGGCTVHHHRLLHYTSPNQSDSPRRALIFVAGLAPLRRPLPKPLPWQERQRTARSLRAGERPPQEA